MTATKNKSRGLGRGLDALFADQTSVYAEEERGRASDTIANDGNKEKGFDVIYLDINNIRPNESQPRKTFDEEKIAELADSIQAHGIIQPLIVRTRESGYELVAGERRWRAARKAGLKEIPCIVREFTDRENMLVAIIENMQREDLNPIEEAEGLNQMIKVYGLTQEEVSGSVSKSRPYITNALRLLKLPDNIRKYISEGTISAGHGRALLSVKDEKLQQALCDKIIGEKLSVRQVEKLVTKGESSTPKRRERAKSAELLRVERELKDTFGTKVTIESNGKKGKISFEYYSRDELERLLDLLKSIEL